MSDINLVNDSRRKVISNEKGKKGKNILEYCRERCNETTEGSVLAIGDGRRFREEQAY